MIKKVDEDLSVHTSIKIGGIAREFLVPESSDELVELIQNRNPKYFIGGGSNLLINNREFDFVVGLDSFDRYILPIERGIEIGLFRVGASVRLQKFINHINDAGYGGIEYLFSVPGLVGGAIYMNAGRGMSLNKSISDYVVSVDVLHNGEIITLTKEQCLFGYRDSVFKHGDYIIMNAILQFPKMDKEESKRLINERMQWCKDTQDSSKPNFGSVFKESNRIIMKLVRALRLGSRDGVYFSGKTVNWILNGGKGIFNEAISIINRVERLHRLLHKTCEKEVVIWE